MQPQSPVVLVGSPNLFLPSPPKRRNKKKVQRRGDILSALRRGPLLPPSPAWARTPLPPRSRPPSSRQGLQRCHLVSLCVVVKATSTPNSRPHDLSLVLARCGRGFVWCLPIWCGVRRDEIAVQPNIFLCFVGRRAAVLRFCFQQPLDSFPPSLLGSCLAHRSH